MRVSNCDGINGWIGPNEGDGQWLFGSDNNATLCHCQLRNTVDNATLLLPSLSKVTSHSGQVEHPLILWVCTKDWYGGELYSDTQVQDIGRNRTDEKAKLFISYTGSVLVGHCWNEFDSSPIRRWWCNVLKSLIKTIMCFLLTSTSAKTSGKVLIGRP